MREMHEYYLALIAVAIAFLLLIEEGYRHLKIEIKQVLSKAERLENGFNSVTDWTTSVAENVARLDSEQDETREHLQWLEREYSEKVSEKVEAERDAAREFERSQELFNEGLRSITDFTGGLPQRGNR